MGEVGHEQIVPGISIDSNGQASVDPAVADVLFDLALQLEEPTKLPVDVQHVLAAVVLAARAGQLDRNNRLTADNSTVTDCLAVHVKTIFTKFGGEVGNDD